jgi:aminoglycoside phosphotransferase family enzyme/predicted kinase
MTMENQAPVIAFLESPSTHGGMPVERIDTHSAVVFLVGDRAWKLKRAVRYDYLDFSTPDRRRGCCEAEVAVNRRTAPALYKGVVAVTCESDGRLALAGRGRPVDWLVEMTRFDQEGLFDRLAARGQLPLELMPGLATVIARFHEVAKRRPEYGGRAGMAWVIDGNAAGFKAFGDGCLDQMACTRLTERARTALTRDGRRLDERRQAGMVRQCHGDLHLRNLVLVDGTPTLFDAVEFNDDIACIDVLYDLSFLIMDLWRHLPGHAHAVLNSYLLETTDLEGLSLLPLFLSCRAAVRAKTSATAAALQSDGDRRAELERLAQNYLTMALGFLGGPGPCLVAVGGLSGTGKSTLARALAPGLGRAPGAVVVRSDEVRKQLHGVPTMTRLGADAYSPAFSRRVYAAMAARASAVVRSGHSAIVDAVFSSAAERAAIEQVAASSSVPFVGLWLDAPEPLLADRVRRRTGDASDADAGVIRLQMTVEQGPIPWHRIDASAEATEVASAASEILKRYRPARPLDAPGSA